MSEISYVRQEESKKTNQFTFESVLNRNLSLLGTQTLGLACHAEALTALAMPNNHPRAADVLELVRSHFTGIRTVGGEISTVLRSNLNVVAKLGENQGQMNEGGAQHNIDVRRNGTRAVEDLDAFSVRAQESVALPVSSDQVAATGFDARFRRSLGTSGCELSGTGVKKKKGAGLVGEFRSDQASVLVSLAPIVRSLTRTWY